MKRHAAIICGLVPALLMATAAAFAQDRGVGGTAAAITAEPQKWAVVIGVGNYQDQGVSKLPKAVNDARAIAKMLVEMPEGFSKDNVTLLADTEGAERIPTRSNLIRFLNSRLALAGPNDTVLVYFAGHGTTEAGALYLLPSDATLTDVAQTGYAFASLETLMNKLPAKKKILILDACHSGTGRATETMSPDAMKEIERASKGMVTLASCEANEKSYEMQDSDHGAFTHFLLEALTGKADKDGDGYVTASETSFYTWDATRRWASNKGFQQTPWRMEVGGGEIVLAKRGGALPVVAPASVAGPAAAAPAPATGTEVISQLTGVWGYQGKHEMSIQCESDKFRVDLPKLEADSNGLTRTISDVQFDGTRLAFVWNQTATAVKGLFFVYKFTCEPADNGARLQVDSELISCGGSRDVSVGQRRSYVLDRLGTAPAQ